MSSVNVCAPSSACLIPVTPRPAAAFVRGQGHELFDEHGRRFLDFVQGWAVNTLGHSPAVIQQTLAEQSAALINPGPAFLNQPMLSLAETLCAHSCFDQAFFASSGAEANEGAIKLARKWGQKYKQGAFKIITFTNGFHGRTLATMSATGKQAFEPLFQPKVDGFSKVPLNDFDATRAAVDDHTVAIMLELVQGEAGVIPADVDFVQQLAQLCHQQNLLLIVDEVQTGIGRTGTLFAYEQYGISPHMMTLAKGLGGGVPISALLIDKAISCFDYGDQGGTYSGNPLMCAVAGSVVNEVLAPGFLASVRRNSGYFRRQLQALSKQFQLGEVRGLGLLLALDTGSRSAPTLEKAAFDAGLLINAPRENALRFMPALTISRKEIDEAIRILARLLSEADH